jgi:sec-independent protein translocase protein TatA
MTNEIMNILAFGMPGGPEWIIILIIAVLIFGRRLPDIARSVGKSITEFKKGIHEAKDDVASSMDEADDIAKESSTTDQDESDTPSA